MGALNHIPHPSPEEDRRSTRTSIGGLMGGNALLLAFFALGWLEVAELIWSFWAHSVTIGFFNYRRMMSLEDFSTEGLTSNGRPVPETEKGKRSTANFFLLHYGGFHAGYLAFMVSSGLPDGGTWLLIAMGAVGFGIGEHAIFRRHLETDRGWRPNIGTLFFQPYLRVIPMHTAGLAALAGTAGAAWFFIPLKLLTDVGMYLIDEHMDARRAKSSEPAAEGQGGAL
jgi:hypothetical protein